MEVVERKVHQRLWLHEPTNAWIESRIAELERGDATPFGVADELLARSGALLTGAASLSDRPAPG